MSPTDDLNDTMLTAEKKYSVNVMEQQNKFCVSVHYNGGVVMYLLMVLKYVNSKERILK